MTRAGFAVAVIALVSTVGLATEECCKCQSCLLHGQSFTWLRLNGEMQAFRGDKAGNRQVTGRYER